MERTSWFKYTDFYECNVNAEDICQSTVVPVNGLCERGQNILFMRQGIYLIAEAGLEEGEIGLNQVVYCGHAGGVGDNSFFNDRIRKHGLKVIGCHIQNGCNNGIASSVRSREYERKVVRETILDHWYVRFLMWPQGRSTELISDFEKSLFLHYHWLTSNSPINLPPLNSQGIGRISALENFEGRVHELCGVEHDKQGSVDDAEIVHEGTLDDEKTIDQFVEDHPGIGSIRTAALSDNRNIFYYTHTPDFRIKMPTDGGNKGAVVMLIRSYQGGEAFTVYLVPPTDAVNEWLGGGYEVNSVQNMGRIQSRVRIENDEGVQAIVNLLEELQNYAFTQM